MNRSREGGRSRSRSPSKGRDRSKSKSPGKGRKNVKGQRPCITFVLRCRLFFNLINLGDWSKEELLEKAKKFSSFTLDKASGSGVLQVSNKRLMSEDLSILGELLTRCKYNYSYFSYFISYSCSLVSY